MLSLEYLRQFRIFNFAVFDFSLSYLGVLLLSPLLNKLAQKLHLNLTTRHWLWLTLPASILIHLLFRIYTPLVKDIIDPTGHYLVKAILLGMTYMGLKDIRQKV